MIKNKWIEGPNMLLIFLLSALLLFYTFYKASNSSFTHDESYTYNHYVNSSVWDIITYQGPDIPNNHILNTLLMKLFQLFFGSSEFALRLPNLLAHLTYIIFTITWLKKLNNNFILLSGFIALNMNPYLLDFFSLARGYGLSVCFMFISFYFLYEYFLSRKRNYIIYSFASAALSVWSNFTLLNYYLALLLTFNIFLLFFLKEKDLQWSQKLRIILLNNLPALLISFILAVAIYKPFVTIRGNLFGPEDGFYNNTLRSLVYSTMHNDVFESVSIVSVFALLVLIVSLLLFLYTIYTSGFNIRQTPHLLIILLAVIPALSTIIQHALFNTQFLENRTGLFFIVLFNINFVYLVYSSMVQFNKKFLNVITGMVYSFFLLVNFFFNFKLNYYADWKYDACTKSMLKTLKEDCDNSMSGKPYISLGITWLFEPTINFYRETKNLDWLNEVSRNGYEGSFDYYYVENDPDFIYKNNKIIVKQFGECNSTLVKSLP